MKFLFKILLGVFTAVSAYVTFTLTYSLANNFHEEVAFSVLGFAFDILKCFLPATFLACFSAGNWGKGFITLLAYLCLTSFSFYASMQLFEASTNRKIEDKAKATVSYTTLQTQLTNYQNSYNGLIALDRITKANKEYSDKIKDTASQMTAIIETAKANTVRNIADLIMNIVVSVLLEISVLSCHISIAIRSNKAAKTANIEQETASEEQNNDFANFADNKNTFVNDIEINALSDAICKKEQIGEGMATTHSKTSATNDHLTDKVLNSMLDEFLAENPSFKLSDHKVGRALNIKRYRAAKILAARKDAQEQDQAKDVTAKSMSKNDKPTSNIILLPSYKN